MQNWGSGMVARGGIIDRRLAEVKYREEPYSTAYPLLTAYWDEDPSYPRGNLIEGNLFYKIGNVVRGRSEWLEMCNNWTTNSDPGFVDPADPMKVSEPMLRSIPGLQDSRNSRSRKSAVRGRPPRETDNYGSGAPGLTDVPLPVQSGCMKNGYSYLMASIGSRDAAFLAGYHPKNTPVTVHTTKESSTLHGWI